LGAERTNVSFKSVQGQIARALVLLMSSVLVTSACGGNGNTTLPEGTQGRLSHEEFDREASEICDRIDDQIDALENPQTDEEFFEAIAEVHALTERGLTELKALNPPVADEPAYARMIAAMESALAASRKTEALYREGDLAGADDANVEFERASAEFDRVARELGLTGCGQSVNQ
jgi:hypothetical protein